VEALFAELKNQIGVRRLRLRRLKFVREQFFLAAAAQNIKRLVRFLSQGPRSRSRQQQLSFIFARNSTVLRYSSPPTSDSAQPFFNTHAVCVEKVHFLQNRQNLGDGKCLGKPRKSFAGLRIAKFFQAFSGE